MMIYAQLEIDEKEQELTYIKHSVELVLRVLGIFIRDLNVVCKLTGPGGIDAERKSLVLSSGQ